MAALKPSLPTQSPVPQPPRENVAFNSPGSNKTSSRQRGKWETLKFPGVMVYYVMCERNRDNRMLVTQTI